MTIEEKNGIMENIKNFCQENAGSRLSPKWLIPALLGSTEHICDLFINQKEVKPTTKELTK